MLYFVASDNDIKQWRQIMSIEEGTCEVCHEYVTPAMPSKTCNCPRIYHEEHAAQLGSCPICKKRF